MNLAKEFLYAAEMTDLLTTVTDKTKWDKVQSDQLGSLSRLFAYLCRV